MRTPLDAFHQALVNHMEERRRAEEGTVRRRRRTGLTDSTAVPGTRVQLRMPANLVREPGWSDMAWFDGSLGTIESCRRYNGNDVGIAEVILDRDTTPGAWSIPLTFLDLASPPPSTENIEDIERWLNEN